MSVTFRSGATSALAYASHTNPSVTAPSGVQNQDVVLMRCVTFGTAGGGAPAPTPSGFTAWPGTSGTGLVGTLSSFDNNSNFTMSLWCFYKVSSGSEPATYSVSQAAGSSAYECVTLVGADNTTPGQSYVSGNTTVSTHTGTHPDQTSSAASVTPTVNGSYVFITNGDNGDTTNNLSLSGWTNEIASPLVLGILSMFQAVAGATGSQSFTNNNSSSQNGPAWLTSTLVVNAAASGGGSFTASDTSTSGDSVTRALPLARSSSETSASSDSVSRSEPQARTAADTSASTDSATRSAQQFPRTSSDTSSSTDSAGRADSLPRTAAETSTSTDSAMRQTLTFARTAADTSASSDSATGGRANFVTTADTSLSSDSTSRQSIHFTRATSDTSLTTDSASSGPGPAPPAPPKICLPTSVNVLAYTSTADLTEYTSGGHLVAYNSTAELTEYESSAEVEPYESTVTVKTCGIGG